MQRNALGLVVLHRAYIVGENDTEGDVHAICDAPEERKQMAHITVVRYNPFTPCGTEPFGEVVERNAETYRARLPNARHRHPAGRVRCGRIVRDVIRAPVRLPTSGFAQAAEPQQAFAFA
ncbi:MAG TPA: hypothetical protein VGE74_30525 [Gemmata sp.]